MSQFVVEDEKVKFFCYTFIKTISESVIGFVLLAATFALLVLALILYNRALKVNMVGGSVKYIYVTLFLWATIYIFKIVIAELIYWIQYSRPQDNTPQVDKNYSYATKYLFGADLIGVFLIQMILILVCYNWMSNIIGIFEQLLQMDDDKAAQIKSYLKFERVCKTLLKIYLRSRFIFFGILIAFIAIPDRDTENILLQTILILLLFEAFLVLIIFSLSMHAIRKNNKLAELVNDGQIQDMIKKYVILTLCALTRCIVDSVFVYYNFFTLTNKETCYVNPEQKSTVMSLLYITFQGFFTHCLPIYIVLRIYRVEQSNIDLTESLLAAEQYTGSTDNPNGTN